MPLDTLANVKRGLAITATTDDDFLGQLQDAADAFIDAHCGRTFTGGSFTEYHPGGGRFAFLRNYPVATVATVKVDPDGNFGSDTIREAASYVVHTDRGVVEAKATPFGPANAPRAVKVDYSTATGAVPAAVQRAYAELIGHWYRESKTRGNTGQLNLIQQTNGGVVTEYAWGQSGGFKVPAGVLQLLAGYRVPAV